MNSSRPEGERLVPNERALTVAVLKEFVKIAKQQDATCLLVPSRNKLALMEDIKAHLDGTLQKRTRRTTRKRKARSDVQLNYETLQQIVELVHDAGKDVRGDVAKIARDHLGEAAAHLSDPDVIAQVSSAHPEFRYQPASAFVARPRLLIIEVALGKTVCLRWPPLSAFCGTASTSSASSWIRSQLGGSSKPRNPKTCACGSLRTPSSRVRVRCRPWVARGHQTRGDFYELVCALPTHAALLAAFGNDKVARAVTVFMDRLLHASSVDPPFVGLLSKNSTYLYDKYIERFNSLLARQLGGTHLHGHTACAKCLTAVQYAACSNQLWSLVLLQEITV